METPTGYYEPRLAVFARIDGVLQPIHLALFGYGWGEWWSPSLPLVKVGEPETPKMPWTIFSQRKPALQLRGHDDNRFKSAVANAIEKIHG